MSPLASLEHQAEEEHFNPDSAFGEVLDRMNKIYRMGYTDWKPTRRIPSIDR